MNRPPPGDPRPELYYSFLVGQAFTFEDGVQIAVAAVKMRAQGVYVTYESRYQGALPRRFTLELEKFIGQYGHLFGIQPPPSPIDNQGRTL